MAISNLCTFWTLFCYMLQQQSIKSIKVNSKKARIINKAVKYISINDLKKPSSINVDMKF